MGTRHEKPAHTKRRSVYLNMQGNGTNMITIRRFSFLVPLVAALLFGCGGGDSPTGTASTASTDDGRKQALAVPAQASATVVSLTKISETRVGRTVYDYVFKITVQNGAVPQQNMVATLLAVGAGTSILDGVVNVGELVAGASTTPADTITLRHDRLKPFDQSALVWQVTSKPFVDPIITGAQYMGGLPS